LYQSIGLEQLTSLVADILVFQRGNEAAELQQTTATLSEPLMVTVLIAAKTQERFLEIREVGTGTVVAQPQNCIRLTYPFNLREPLPRFLLPLRPRESRACCRFAGCIGTASQRIGITHSSVEPGDNVETQSKQMQTPYQYANQTVSAALAGSDGFSARLGLARLADSLYLHSCG
jgi:hypothetical protein